MSNGRLRGYSAGSHPGGKVNPFAAELCAEMHYPAQNLRSKSWDEFGEPGAPVMDLIVTVCDSGAGEACPGYGSAIHQPHMGIA